MVDASDVYGRDWALQCGGCYWYVSCRVLCAAWRVLLPKLHSVWEQPESFQMEIRSIQQLGSTANGSSFTLLYGVLRIFTSSAEPSWPLGWYGILAVAWWQCAEVFDRLGLFARMVILLYCMLLSI